MKHRMFLSLLLAFLGFLGVRAADEVTTTVVTFDDFGTTAAGNPTKWKSQFGWNDINAGVKTASMYVDPADPDAGTYDIVYEYVYRNADGIGLLKSEAKDGVKTFGYMTFPVFHKKVQKIELTTINAANDGRSVQLYDVKKSETVALETMNVGKANTTYTFNIATPDASAQYMIKSTGNSNATFVSIKFYLIESKEVSPQLTFQPTGPFRVKSDEISKFSAPKLGMSDLAATYLKDNIRYRVDKGSNVATVNEKTGAVSLTGAKGVAKITAYTNGGEYDVYTFDPQEISYNVVVYSPEDKVYLPKDEINSRELWTLTNQSLKDDTGVAEYFFAKVQGSNANNLTYDASSNVVLLRKNTYFSVKVLEPGYVLDNVEIKTLGGDKFAPCTSSAGVYTPAASGNINVWNFDNAEVTSAMLTYTGDNDVVRVDDIIVTIRKPKFTITPSADITVNHDEILKAASEYFTLSNFGFGGSAADYVGKLVYTVDEDAVAKNIAKIEGNKIVLLGENGVATVTATYPGGDVYGKTSASFKITVTGAVVMTATTEDVTLALYGTNGDLTVKAPIVLKHKDKVIDSFKGKFTYKPADEKIATVDAEGNITAVAEGKTTVTVTYAGEDYEMAPATINVVVEDRRPQPVVKFTADKVIYLTNSKDAFVAPTLTETLENVVWKSSNEALATVNGGVITLKDGVTGQAVITAEIVAGETTKGAKASYTIVVADPKGELALDPKSQYMNTTVPSVEKTDAAELVSFVIGRENENADRAVFNGNYIIFNTDNNVVVTAKKNGYYLAKVEIEYFDGSKAITNASVPENTTFNNGVWDFSKVDLTTATLVNTGSAAQIKDIKVTLRYARLNIAAKETTVARQINDPAIKVAEFFTVTDHNNQPVEGLPITYTSDNADLPIDNNGVITLNKVGDAKITAEFAGNDNFEAASASFTLSVSKTAPVKISFNENMDKTLELYTADGAQSLNVLENITAIDGKDLVSLEESKKLITVEKADAANKAISIENGVVKAVEPGKAIVNVVFAGDDHNAKTTASFEVEVVDSRKALSLVFSPLTYTYDLSSGKDFTNPVPALPEGLTATDLKWESSNKDVLTVENGIVKFADKVNGVQTVTVTASYEDYAVNNKNWAYLPASASYTLTVIGDAAWLEATPSLSGDVKVRGYIVGTITGNDFRNSEYTGDYEDTNIAIALNKGEKNAANVVRVVLSGANKTNFNLKNNKEKVLNNQIIITGKATGAKAIGTVSNAMLLTEVPYTISDTEVPSNFATVTVTVPAGVSDYTISAPGAKVNGNNITFSAEGEYKVTVKNDEKLPYLATEKVFTVNVTGEVQAEDVTFFFAHPANADAPKIRIISNKGVEYAAAEHATTLGQWHEMTAVPDKFIGYDRQVYTYTAKVPAHELNGNTQMKPQSAKRRAPQYGEDTEKNTLVGPNTNVADDAKTNLNVYVGDGTQDINGDNVTKISNAPITPGLVYAASPALGRLYVWEVNAKGEVIEQQPIGTLVNDNTNATNNLWSGELEVNNVDNLSIILSTQVETNDMGVAIKPAGTIFEGATENNGATLAEGINNYAEWLNGDGKTRYNQCVKYCRDNKLSEADAEKYMNDNYYSVMYDEQKQAIQTLSEVSEDKASYTPVNLSVKDLNKSNDQNSLYTSVELRRPLSGNTEDEGVYAISFSFNPDDIATDVEEIEAADVDGEVMWFNLQGERLAQPTEGIMIRIQGNKAQKVLIRD